SRRSPYDRPQTADQVHYGQGHRPYALYVLPGSGHSAGLPAEKLTGLEDTCHASPSAFSTHAFSSVTGIPLLCAKEGNKTANRLYV
ncbi:hypothetical protein GUA89_29105, partial [Escherichia coli]|nr:hypothetical protein [Escherichia coli]